MAARRMDRKIGDVDIGPAAAFDEDEAILSCYDHLFKNIVNDFEHSNPVRLFVMGVNQPDVVHQNFARSICEASCDRSWSDW